MKYTKIGILTAAVLGICQIASADALLIDAYADGGANPDSYTAWANAGVTEDISDGAGGTYSYNGNIYNIEGMTGTSSFSGSYTGAFPENNMLDDYLYTKNATASFSLGGLDSGVTTDGYSTQIYGDMEGNTFTLQANQDYKLYLFGVDATDGVQTTFMFDEDGSGTIEASEERTTTGWSADGEASHYVTYEFTTGADVSGYSLDFSFKNVSPDEYAAFNGLALVAIPEPATLGLITAFGGGVLFIRRRFMI